MVSNKPLIHRRAAMIHEQMAAAWACVRGEISEQEFFGPDNPYYKLLDRLYAEDYQLSILLEASDLVLHAEGPAAKDAMPTLHAVNWLISSAERQLRTLAKAIFDLSTPNARKIAQGIDLRMTGFAPGSIYAGLKLEPEGDSLFGDPALEPVFVAVRDSIRQLPIIPSFVGDEAIEDGICEAIPDPAQRDAGLFAAFNLSPTGRFGIHTLEIFTPGERPAELSQRERVVIREALKRPRLAKKQSGSFIGELREIDLDRSRFHIRVDQIGILRCVFPNVTADDARPLLGKRVRVSGDYEEDAQGRPRLMLVSDVEVVPMPEQHDLALGVG